MEKAAGSYVRSEWEVVPRRRPGRLGMTLNVGSAGSILSCTCCPKEVPMWSWKKPATPKQDMSKPATSAPSNLPANDAPEAGQSAAEEAAKLNSGDAMLPPRASTAPATSWVGSSLHVKGEISGEEDLLVDGSVDGRIELGDRNLTIGTTAKVMADIIAGDVVVYGKVSGNVRQRLDRDQERRFGDRGFDNSTDPDRGRCMLQ